jgi:hypothetical protein
MQLALGGAAVSLDDRLAPLTGPGRAQPCGLWRPGPESLHLGLGLHIPSSKVSPVVCKLVLTEIRHGHITGFALREPLAK